MANTKVSGDLIQDGAISQNHLNESHGITTSDIGEGTALYYTDARVANYLTTNNYATQSYVSTITTNSANWDTAYGWGNHASQGYATETYVGTAIANLVNTAPTTLDTLNELAAALGDDPNFATTVSNSIGLKLDTSTWTASAASSITSTNITNWNTAYGWGDHSAAGYLTAFTETDPIYVASSWYTTTNNAANWDTAYSWGNHASAGYITEHPSISAASSVNNSGNSVIQDITLDSNGHIIGLTSIDLNDSYYNEAEIDNKLTNGTVNYIADDAQVGTNIHFFKNDGGGNLGIRFNAGPHEETSIEDGSAWEFQFENDSQNGDFTIYYDGDISSAGQAISWTQSFRLDGGDSEAYVWGNRVLTTEDPASGITSTNISNWEDAYAYSQVGHLPLAGGTVSGQVTFNNMVTFNNGPTINGVSNAMYFERDASERNVMIFLDQGVEQWDLWMKDNGVLSWESDVNGTFNIADNFSVAQNSFLNNTLLGTSSSTGIDTTNINGAYFALNGEAFILDPNYSTVKGRIAYSVGPQPYQPSIKTASDGGMSNAGTSDNGDFPNTAADSEGFASSTTYTYAAALSGLQGDGARLPRLEEVIANYGTGSGDSTDTEWIWTQTKGYKDFVYQVKGNYDTYPEFRLVDPKDTNNVARVRRFFDISKANLPVYYDSNSRINAKEIRAEHSDGLKLYDNGGSGIFIKDGGFVGIGSGANPPTRELHVAGSVQADDFYDNENTNYYLNPRNNSRLRELSLGTTIPPTLKGNLHIYNGTAFGEFYVSAQDSPYTTSEGVNESPAMRLHLDNGAGGGFEICMDDDDVDRESGNNGFAFRILTQDGGFDSYSRSDAVFNVSTQGHTYIGYKNTRSGISGDPMLAVNGVITASNDIVAYQSSDKRLKDNIKPIKNATNKIKNIGGYEFNWNNNQNIYNGHDIGVIAQEVEKIAPSVVETRKDGYKAVKYEKLVPLLIEAIKELSNKVEELENKLNGTN